MTAGNPSGTLMPRSDMRVGTVTFQDWTDGSSTFRAAQFENVPRGILGEAKTFERYSGGGDLGSFSKNWPVAMDDVKADSLKALPPRNPAPTPSGGEYPSNFASSNLIDGTSGQTLAQVVSSPGFDGRLTYVAPSAARIDFVTLALCTSALPQKTSQSAPVSQAPTTMSEADIAARIAELQSSNNQSKNNQDVQDTENTLAAVQARAEAARKAAEEEAEALRRAEAARLAEQERLEAEAAEIEANRLETERLQAERFEQDRLAQEQQTAAALIITPPAPPTQNSQEEPNPKPISSGPTEELREDLLKGDAAQSQTKRDMLTSAAMAGSALLNVAAQGLMNVLRGSPSPAPAPAPLPTQANVGRLSRENSEDEGEDDVSDIPDMPDDIPSLEEVEKYRAAEPPEEVPAPTPNPAMSQAASNISSESDSHTDDHPEDEMRDAVIIPGSTTSTGPIETTNAAILNAYDAVGRVGYPHAENAPRDAKDLGFGSAVLISPDKVLTNHHVWSEIKSKTGIGVEFNAREGETISEFITLNSMSAEVFDGHDAVVLTLSRRLPRAPLWPCDLDYTSPDIEGREIIVIGHPKKPDEQGWLMKQAILEAFGKNPLWNVKRHSRGPLVIHSSDTDDNILFDVPVRAAINPYRSAVALCHKATTISGFSGGAVIDAQTGDFLGLHFGGQVVEGEEINHAVPGRALLQWLTSLETKNKRPNASAEVQPKPHKIVETPLNSTPSAEPESETKDTQTGDLFEFTKANDATEPKAVDKKIADDSDPSKSETFTDYLIEKSPPPSTIAPSPNGEDDLTLIEGIGPKTAKALQDHGIRSFKTLSQGSPYDLLPVLEAAGLPRRDPTTWPAQAALAASGDWDRLKAWQDKLHGGREVS
jgi:predicted flap endonuclease-1-like 5' DNA nuclease